MPKKILLLRFTPYDTNYNSYNVQEIGIGKAFCRLGYDYDHICFRRENPKEWVFYEYNGCKARYIEYPRFRLLRMGLNMDICKKNFLDKYDIVICREYYQIMSYIVSKNCSHASLYSGPYWNMFMFKFVSPIYDFLFTKSINKQMNCKFVKSVLAKEFLERKGYTQVLNIGVGLDMERFNNETDVLESTKQLMEFMSLNPCLLFVGQLNENKNFPLLVEIYSRIIKIHPEIRFVMIGKPVQTMIGKLMRKTNESYVDGILSKYPENVSEGILRINRIDNSQLKYIYPLAKAFLLPSKKEIFGMVLLEAMYLGAPVVTSKNGGSMTLIDKKSTGQMISEYDAELWTNAVLKYLENPLYAENIRLNARTIVEREYTWDAIAIKMLKALERKNNVN